ncbi:MAG: hypothetical protein WD187_01005 [Candidatus Woykebacteria bacterium]
MFLARLASTVKFIWLSLRPVAVILLVFIVVVGSLFAYDTYYTYKDRKLGAQLIEKVKLESECGKTVNQMERLTLDFTITNTNSQDVNLEKLSIDQSILGVGDKNFFGNPRTVPLSTLTEKSENFAIFEFDIPLTVSDSSNEKVNLSLKATDKTSAGASSHTIVIYEGKIIFYFDHQMSIETPCQLQVRYP